MTSFIVWLTTQPAGRRRLALMGLAAAAVAVGATGALWPAAAPILGAAAGAGLFLAATGAWHTLLPAERQQATDLKSRYSLARRRAIVGALAAAWVVMLLLAGPTVPAVMAGTLNVWVVLHLYWLFRATPAEAAAQRAAYEAARATNEEAAVLRRMEADLSDPEGPREP